MLRSILAFTACCLCVHALAGERAIIVLDASGSMWGQLQGKSKIELARETLDSVLTSIPDDLHGDVESRQVTMAAPAKLGGFQLRYWNGENKAVLSTRPLIVE